MTRDRLFPIWNRMYLLTWDDLRRVSREERREDDCYECSTTFRIIREGC